MPPEVTQLLTAAKAVKQRGFQVRRDAPPGDDQEPLQLPHLTALLDGDLSGVASLDPDTLLRLDQMADLATWSGLLDTTGARHPILAPIEDKLLEELAANPAYAGDDGRNVALLASVTVSFMSMRWDTPAEYMKLLKPQERPPGEEALQTDYATVMKVCPPLRGRVSVERSDIAGGRADVHFQFDQTRRYVAEIKRELTNARPANIEKNYLGQPLAYQSAGSPFGLLLVLDVTDHSAGWPALRDSIWVKHETSAEGTMRSVIVGVVPGNRPTPRQVKMPTRP